MSDLNTMLKLFKERKNREVNRAKLNSTNYKYHNGRSLFLKWTDPITKHIAPIAKRINIFQIKSDVWLTIEGTSNREIIEA